MNTRRIYFDNNATTPISQLVRRALPEALEAWGNPSSIHWAGRGPKTLLREARQKLANSLGVHPLELIFTSGGSEANSTAIKGVFFDKQNSEQNEYITTKVEHPSVIRAFQFLQSLGAKVHYLDISHEGKIDLEQYQSCLSPKTALVSVMYANNETGVIFPIKEMAAMAHEQGALFHSDAVQALGKVPVNLAELGVDLASFSAHKFYALKGTGILFSRRGTEWLQLIHGGGQERNRRGGTENVLGIHAMGVMSDRLREVEFQGANIARLRDHLEARICKEISAVTITHQFAPRLPNTSSLVIPGADGETLLMSLDLKGYAVSTGAACSSGNPEPSPTLLAIGLSRQQAQNSLRISLGWDTEQEHVDSFVETLKLVVARLRSLGTESEMMGNHV